MKDGELYYDLKKDRLILVLQWDRYSLPILLERLYDGQINVFHSDEYDHPDRRFDLTKVT